MRVPLFDSVLCSVQSQREAAWYGTSVLCVQPIPKLIVLIYLELHNASQTLVASEGSASTLGLSGKHINRNVTSSKKVEKWHAKKA